jgi:hypothetical protein
MLSILGLRTAIKGLEGMKSKTRRISAIATAVALGVPSATAAFPVLGVAGGLIATAAIAAGGLAGFLLMVPETAPQMTPQERLHPDVQTSLSSLLSVCDSLGAPEIEAALRHSAQALLPIANDPSATVADLSFVILNMESLLGIAAAWKNAEQMADPHKSDNTIAAYTIKTIADVTQNARQRRDVMRSRSIDSLQVELTVTRRINKQDRKGMQS